MFIWHLLWWTNSIKIEWGVSNRPLAVTRRRFCARPPTVQNGAKSRFIHLERGRKRRGVRRQIDNRPDVQVAIRTAIQTPPMPGAGSKKPVTPTIESSLSSARARKKRNAVHFMIGLLLLLVCMLHSRGCPDFCLPCDRLAAAAGLVSAITGESSPHTE